MQRFPAVVVLVLCACAGQGTNEPAPGEVARSREIWNGLEAEMGGTYWYEDENCVMNAASHTVALIQVEDGVAARSGTRSIATSECVGRVNRYADAQELTLPMLYDVCEALVAREGEEAVTVTLDALGVIESCIWEGGPGCSDNCGEGFLLRDWGFGRPATP